MRKARDGSVDWKVLSTHALEQLRRREEVLRHEERVKGGPKADHNLRYGRHRGGGAALETGLLFGGLASLVTCDTCVVINSRSSSRGKNRGILSRSSRDGKGLLRIACHEGAQPVASPSRAAALLPRRPPIAESPDRPILAASRRPPPRGPGNFGHHPPYFFFDRGRSARRQCPSLRSRACRCCPPQLPLRPHHAVLRAAEGSTAGVSGAGPRALIVARTGRD